jgi:hypothetical protein
MFENLPKLKEEEVNMLKQPITMEELEMALNTCEESAPGPDGITYGVYKKTWTIFGPLLHKSWQYSNNLGELSTTQKDSVITLLDKKGKDRTLIENLRPISLSNCDIKICTKAIALRTNKVLNTILSTSQTGYVPGRQVNDNTRLIEEVIENAKRIKEESYLITLDAQKAFDSVDHTYLQDILRKYGFPPEYLAWVKIIYNDLRASVLINGYQSETFKIGRSVKQGDALSCALFVIAIDPLLRAIEIDEGILPIIITTPNQKATTIDKALAYADDITALCRNKEGVIKILEAYSKFSEYSGIKLNIGKTEILVMGKQGSIKTQFQF